MSDNPLFGICPVCSSDGGDHPQSDLTPADAGYSITDDRTVANDYLIDTAQDGVPLVKHNGKVMCNTCKERLKADEESRIASRKHARDEQFRAKAGFVKTI